MPARDREFPDGRPVRSDSTTIAPQALARRYAVRKAGTLLGNSCLLGLYAERAACTFALCYKGKLRFGCD